MLNEFGRLLFLLSAAHVLCDWPLQTAEMSAAKRPGRSGVDWRVAIVGHGLIHGGAVALVTGQWLLGVAETAAHSAIDGMKVKHLFGMKTDQALHMACKVAWAAAALMAMP